MDEAEGAEQNIWIMKPTASSQGRGIFLVNNLNDVSYSQNMVVQRYIKNPLLINGFKFDLRLYVCVLSFAPTMEAFIHSKGFARYSSQKYASDAASLENTMIHLTNSSIQNKVMQADNAESGSKQSLEALWAVLASQGLERGPLWAKICEVVLRSLFCVVEQMGVHPNCFELFGYDILIDDECNAHLIEVNSSPAMTRHNPLDHAVKDEVIADTIRLVSPPPFDRDALGALLQKHTSCKGGGSRRRGAGGLSAGTGSSAAQLAQDLHGVLGDEYATEGARALDVAQPVLPEGRLGGFEQLAPSKMYDAICRPFGKAKPR